jgi:hypothetical protein
MTRRTLTRWLSPLVFATALVAGPASTPARAQQPVAEGEAAKEEAGRSGDGYIIMFILAGIVLFAVAKSARR